MISFKTQSAFLPHSGRPTPRKTELRKPGSPGGTNGKKPGKSGGRKKCRWPQNGEAEAERRVGVNADLRDIHGLF
jgi:hypothetical protein